MKRRNTKHKEKILEEFKNKHIIDGGYLVRKFPEINSATIYRNLRKFLKDGVIKEVRLGNGKISYELDNGDEHQHFMCTMCGDVQAIHIAEYQIKSAIPKHLSVSEIQINMQGVCERCY